MAGLGRRDVVPFYAVLLPILGYLERRQFGGAGPTIAVLAAQLTAALVVQIAYIQPIRPFPGLWPSLALSLPGR
jgi:hypothetical protein